MQSEDHRRSMRILELEARKAEKAVNKKKLDMSLGNIEGQSSQSQSRKKPKVNHASGINATNSGEALAVPSKTPVPQTSALELLLDMLKRRDTLKIFTEPVNSAQVQGYDDIVKKPMDFATISAKLTGGQYSSLEDFERDIFLVFSNAMLFNNSKTLYYRQAHAIKEVAKKLFTALRTDASNFEIEFSLARQDADRWTKAEARLINSNSWNHSKNVTTAGKVFGSAGAGTYDGLVERRTTYKPRTSYPNEVGASMSTVLNAAVSEKPLIQIDQRSLGHGLNVNYKDSLLNFTLDLGPVPQIVAQRKLDEPNNGFLIRNHVPFYHPHQVRNPQQIPWTTYGSGGRLPSVHQNPFSSPLTAFNQYPVHNCQPLQQQLPGASSPERSLLPLVHQNPFGSPVTAFNPYPVHNYQPLQQQFPYTSSPVRSLLPSVYQEPFGSPVRVNEYHEDAQRDDLDSGSAPQSDDGKTPSMFEGMDLDDFLILLMNM